MRRQGPPAWLCHDTRAGPRYPALQGLLFRTIADKIETWPIEKGYDVDTIPEELAKAEIEAVIPAKNNRR